MNIDHCYILALDKRIEETNQLCVDIAKNLHTCAYVFVVGDGNTLTTGFYDLIDTPEIPHKFPLSTNYPTWFRRHNAYSAFKSHKEILKIAQKNQFDSIMIIEDDVKFEEDFDKIWSAVQPTIPSDWDMLYFGSYHNNKTFQPINDNLCKVNGCAGWHAVLIRNTLFQYLVDLPPYGPYDECCGRFVHPTHNCYAIHPCIISQKDGFSYVENENLTKPSRHFYDLCTNVSR